MDNENNEATEPIHNAIGEVFKAIPTEMLDDIMGPAFRAFFSSSTTEELWRYVNEVITERPNSPTSVLMAEIKKRYYI